MKRCLHCDKELILPETTNSYLRSNFRLRKFCDDKCRIDFNNKIKKKNYILKNTEHDNKLKELNNLIRGSINFNQNKTDDSNPDLIKGDNYYELEIFRKSNMRKKINRWNKSKKHILVINISDQTKQLFDEVFLLSDKHLINLE